MAESVKLSYMSIATGNKENLKKSKFGYCLCCKKNHPAKNIVEFCDEKETTAQCPNCFVDAIIPDYPTQYSSEQFAKWSKNGFGI